MGGRSSNYGREPKHKVEPKDQFPAGKVAMANRALHTGTRHFGPRAGERCRWNSLG